MRDEGVVAADAALEQRIAAVCERAIAEQVFPGCTVGYQRHGQGRVLAFGRLTYDKQAPAVTAETVYDVASVTKSVPTAVLALKLVEDGELGLDEPVIRYVPELEGRYRERVLVRHLLAYTVVFDLPGGLGEVARAHPGEVLEAIWRADLVAPPGERYVYTNAPAIVLGLVVERIAGRRLDELAQTWLFEPLGMAQTTFHPQQLAAGTMVAPTEIGWRGELRGVVHDDAAWALQQGGVMAGNAGLFASAGDLLRFAAMLLQEGLWDGRRYFRPETVRLMHTNQIAALGGSTGLGWELNWPLVMGEQASDQTFGKTGFTGCLLLMDAKREAALVHLSNRTYPHQAATREAIHAVRRALADAVLGT